MNSDEIDDPEWIDIMVELTKVAEKHIFSRTGMSFLLSLSYLNGTTVQVIELETRKKRRSQSRRRSKSKRRNKKG